MHDRTAMPGRLADFLTERDGRTARVVAYEPMIGGYSRSMARADVEWSDGTTETIVLRGDPPPGKSMMQTDRELEWTLLRALTTSMGEHDRLLVPMARFYDDTGDALGTKCIIMDFVEGRSLQSALNAIIADAGSAEPDWGSHPYDLVDTMAAVHAVEPSRVAPVLDEPADWETHMLHLIDGFRRAERAHPESNPFLRYVAAWLEANLPTPLPLRLVHSDFNTANVMVDSSGRHQMIDWELAHVGDPREDLGYYNIYSSASGPNLFMADPEGFLARYRERTGFDEEAVNMDTVAYFSSLAAITVYSQVLGGAGAMYEGTNGGLMTTYTINALTVGHNNFMRACVAPSPADENGVAS